MAVDVGAGLAAGHRALERMAHEVTAAGARFDQVAPAIELLLAVPGRVVVTGLGKSGLVGAKIAATLASTGTPTFFVHAADALHGDAGMVAADDVLLAISKSGETTEVVAFASLVKRRGAAVLAMTGCGGTSRLRRLSDADIDIAVGSEADPWDMVPTASTAVTAVLGDALAVALMVARGFGPTDFSVHHPAGTLGARLRSAAD